MKVTPMAKRTDHRTNKSEEIRKLVKGGAKPMEIQAKLAERGIKVSTPMIYTVRSKMKARRSAHKISRRRAAANSNGPLTDIRTLARFIRAVHDVGGVADARKILSEMEE